MRHVSYRSIARASFEWARSPFSLGQATEDCVGDVCYPIVSRVDKTGATALLASLRASSAACVDSAGGQDKANAIAQKLERATLGIEASIGLTAPDKKFLDAIQACTPSPAPSIPGVASPAETGSPWTLPLVVGGGAVGIAVLASLLWGGK